ncbi:MAG TPA: phosphoribosylformylglycinamidine cyclo-ligase [Gemmatimonadaceae bacterium]|nr:phosphoribosylformylglycinamidine cyclo-ligase [Gemmatimonadaceae bacterium]
MSDEQPLDYAAAGVDIDRSDSVKNRIRAVVESTFTAGARGSFGGFGGMFRIPAGFQRPVLVSSADGVGTKLRVAIESGRHHTVGHDLVNHCVNDILVQGAVPLFFLDYFAAGRLEPEVVEAVVTGVAAGCRENGCSLVGGETAEMPGIYTPPDYDLAGFIVGCVEEDAILGADRVEEGDVILGLASSGLHTNGYSLARRIVAERMRLQVGDQFPGESATVADVLLRIHRSYLPLLRPILGKIHGMAHITGGGLPGNVNRVLPDTLDAVIDGASWPVPNLFVQLERNGQVSRDEMYRTFNMGVGMVVITDESGAAAVEASASSANVDAWRLGRTVRGTGRVRIT